MKAFNRRWMGWTQMEGRMDECAFLEFGWGKSLGVRRPRVGRKCARLSSRISPFTRLELPANPFAGHTGPVDPERLSQHVRAVESMFAGVPRPECTKRVARALDDEWFPDAERVRELQALDPETRWQDLTDDDLEEYANTLSWMSPEAVRFYYPALLSSALRHWNDHSRIHLEVMEPPGYDPRMLDEFSADEKKLIHAILCEPAATPEGASYNAFPTLLAFQGRLG
jgi:hypothetical protein